MAALVSCGSTSVASPPPPAAHATARTTPTPAPADLDPRTPVGLAIPALGVHAYVERSVQGADGSPIAPARWEDVSWFSQGYYPGDVGSAVILGHLDTDQASHPEAVFWHLDNLVVNDEIDVYRIDGTMIRFRVTGSETDAADTFPVSTVFGTATVPTLRLITCAGHWRGSTLGYSQRLVVTSTLEGPRRVQA